MSEEWEPKYVPTHPIKGRWVRTITRIRLNATGEIREHEDVCPIWDGDTQPSDFIWEEGNFACDCNRGSFFDGQDHDCGHDRYAVERINPTNGRVFYSDFDD